MRHQVRWWVIMVGIMLAWILTCFGPVTARAQQVQVASDSATLRRLAEFRQSDDYDRVVCLAAHWETVHVIVVDSIVSFSALLPCPPGAAGLAANAEPGLPESTALLIGRRLLAEYPALLLACALHDVVLENYAGVWLTVPLVWCAYRTAS